MQNVLKVLSKHLKPHLSPESVNSMPYTLHLLTKRASKITGVGAGCRSFYRHFCTICGEIFPLDVLILLCAAPGCTGERFDRTGKPLQRALYYDLRDKLERLLQDRRMGAFLMLTLPPSTIVPLANEIWLKSSTEILSTNSASSGHHCTSSTWLWYSIISASRASFPF